MRFIKNYLYGHLNHLPGFATFIYMPVSRSYDIISRFCDSFVISNSVFFISDYFYLYAFVQIHQIRYADRKGIIIDCRLSDKEIKTTFIYIHMLGIL